MADRPPIELPHPVRMRVLGAVMVGVFLAALDQTVVGTALPRIITDLGGNGLYTWAFTAYLLTSTISGPIYGKLSDLFGRRPVLLFGISVFMLGSLLAGLSQEMWQLVARARRPGPRRRRAVPGRDGRRSRTCSRRPERGRYQGLFGAVFGLSSLLGPAIGGLLTDTVGWPFVFFINIPIGARRCCSTVRRYLPAYHPAGERPRIDYLGAALFTGALVPILVGLTNKQAADWFDPTVGGLIGLGVRHPRRVRVGRVPRGRADRPAGPVPQPRVHDLGDVGVPRGVRVLRRGRVPAALVPGRRRRVRDDLRLPDAAAAGRRDHQRGRARARSSRGPAATGC